MGNGFDPAGIDGAEEGAFGFGPCSEVTCKDPEAPKL